MVDPLPCELPRCGRHLGVWGRRHVGSGAWTLVSWTLEATAFYARSDQEWVLCACGQW